jgi:hypothetical protein
MLFTDFRTALWLAFIATILDHPESPNYYDTLVTYRLEFATTEIAILAILEYYKFTIIYFILFKNRRA